MSGTARWSPPARPSLSARMPAGRGDYQEGARRIEGGRAMRAGAFVMRGLARAIVHLFYHRVDVVGVERVPPSGPLVIVANHQNALIDPLILIATLPRAFRPLAKAPLF